METPNTVEGQLTEKIMYRVSRKVDLSTAEYNMVWSAVLETLQEELGPLLRGATVTRKDLLNPPG